MSIDLLGRPVSPLKAQRQMNSCGIQPVGTSCSSGAAEATLVMFGPLNHTLTPSQQRLGRSRPLCCSCCRQTTQETGYVW